MAKTNNDITQIEEELKVDKNTLLGKWRAKAYDQKADKGWLQKFWNQYFVAEKGIYQKLLGGRSVAWRKNTASQSRRW